MRNWVGVSDTLQMVAAFELGSVTVPSGVLVLGIAGWIDSCPQPGESLSQQAAAAAMCGGGHLSARFCEAALRCSTRGAAPRDSRSTSLTARAP